MDRKIEITTLRTLANDCPDNIDCPSINKIADRPGRRYVVLKQVTDPAEQAALAHLVGPDELVGWAPDQLFEEV